jgi:hypothetical protein
LKIKYSKNFEKWFWDLQKKFNEPADFMKEAAN